MTSLRLRKDQTSQRRPPESYSFYGQHKKPSFQFSAESEWPRRTRGTNLVYCGSSQRQPVLSTGPARESVFLPFLTAVSAFCLINGPLAYYSKGAAKRRNQSRANREKISSNIKVHT